MTHGVHSSEMPTRGCRKGAHFKTIAASFISTMKVDSPVMMLSLAPIRVKMRSVGESLPDKNTLSGTVRNQQALARNQAMLAPYQAMSAARRNHLLYQSHGVR